VALARTQKTTISGGAAGTGTDANYASSSFTPADNSLLVAKFNCITNSAQLVALSIAGGGLTWTKRIETKPDTSNGTNAYSYAVIWTAPVTTGASMTVTVSWTGAVIADTFLVAGLEVEEWTGYDTTTPVGLTGGEFVYANAPHSGVQHTSLGGTTASTSRVTGCLISDGDTGDPQINADTGFSNGLQYNWSGQWPCIADIYQTAAGAVTTCDWASWTRAWGHADSAIEIRAAGGAPTLTATNLASGAAALGAPALVLNVFRLRPDADISVGGWRSV